MSGKAQNFWRVRGYNGLTPFYDVQIPTPYLSENQLKALLRCLAAKEGLSYDEIVGAYAKRKTTLRNDHLEITKNGPYPEYSCGYDPHFVAIVVDSDGKRVQHPPPL